MKILSGLLRSLLFVCCGVAILGILSFVAFLVIWLGAEALEHRIWGPEPSEGDGWHLWAEFMALLGFTFIGALSGGLLFFFVRLKYYAQAQWAGLWGVLLKQCPLWSCLGALLGCNAGFLWSAAVFLCYQDDSASHATWPPVLYGMDIIRLQCDGATGAGLGLLAGAVFAVRRTLVITKDRDWRLGV